MNKFVSIALAGTVALSTIAVSATVASADGWRHRPHHPPYQAAPAYDPGPAIFAGTILGLAVGSLLQPYPTYPAYPAYPAYASPPPPPPYPSYGEDEHFQWCTATYESYNGETDTWTDYRGVPHLCVGPY